MLLDIALGIVESDIRDIAFCIVVRSINRVYEALVWCEVEFLITLQNLAVQVLIYFHSIFLHHCFSCRVITLGSDALDLAEQLAIEVTNTLVIIDLEVVLAVTLDHLYLVVLGVLEYPESNQLTVAHV